MDLKKVPLILETPLSRNQCSSELGFLGLRVLDPGAGACRSEPWHTSVGDHGGPFFPKP